MKTVSVFTLALVSLVSLSARADEICAVTQGGSDDPTIYAIKIADEVLPHRAGDPADTSPMRATRDVQILQGGKEIGHFAKSTVSMVGDEGTVGAEVKVGGVTKLSLFIDGRDCADDLCPAVWTQPGLGFKNAPAVCYVK